MAKYVHQVILDYGIEKNLGYFVMDNAPDNDTMIANLSQALRRDQKLQYDPIHHRLRCQGHVINLAVKSFIFVTDKENIEEDVEINAYMVMLAEIEEWRKKGPLGKLHNFVVWLAGSTQRLHNFLALANQRIPRDNSTRWNSWYMMLSIAWILRGFVEEFFDLYADAQLEADRLSDDEWGVVRIIKDFLEKLSMSTKACESSKSTLDLVLPSMDYILGEFEKAKQWHKDDPIFAPMFNSGWAKMAKYYGKTDKTPAYIAALVLHPSRKWRWVEKHWEADWVTNGKSVLKDFWEKRYKPPMTIPSTPLPSQSSALTNAVPLNDFLRWIKEDDDDEIEDEYERYCALPQVLGIINGYK